MAPPQEDEGAPDLDKLGLTMLALLNKIRFCYALPAKWMAKSGSFSSRHEVMAKLSPKSNRIEWAANLALHSDEFCMYKLDNMAARRVDICAAIRKAGGKVWNTRFQKTSVMESSEKGVGYSKNEHGRLRITKQELIDQFMGLRNVGHFFAQHAIGILARGFQTQELRLLGVQGVMDVAACGGGASFGARLMAAARLGFMPSQFAEIDCGLLIAREWPALEKTAQSLLEEGLIHAIPAPLVRINKGNTAVLLAGLPEILEANAASAHD